eukprot:TRINITY_DN4350_c0_g1_i1.p1 TRINITY_DN4350_c0_g1~~TRINITY_DN4350_c0_g1_i1.p1  ORF type:complete len:171 (+),score=21.52 TRINITY_DN4350_c0_g1_i1:52-564(+)
MLIFSSILDRSILPMEIRLHPMLLMLLMLMAVGLGSAQSWVEQAILTATPKSGGDRFGHSVSLSGNYALVGAGDARPGTQISAGVAFVFFRAGLQWNQQTYLTASNRALADNFGISVSLDHDCAAVGASQTDQSSMINTVCGLALRSFFFLKKEKNCRYNLLFGNLDQAN